MKQFKPSAKKQKRRQNAVKGGTARLVSPYKIIVQRQTDAADLANKDNGILRPNLDKFDLPNSLLEAGGDRKKGAMPGPFMLTITALAIIFIAVIAYFVSQMPDK